LPSEKILEEKKRKVQEIRDKLSGAASVILVDYKGISVAADTRLRAELRAAGVDYFVLKNSLLRFALEDAGLEDFLPYLKGSSAVAVSGDAMAPSKVIQKYSDSLRDIFNVKSGYVDGKFVTAAEVKSIASLPPRDVLVAMVAGSLNGIVASLARALSEVAKKQAA